MMSQIWPYVGIPCADAAPNHSPWDSPDCVKALGLCIAIVHSPMLVPPNQMLWSQWYKNGLSKQARTLILLSSHHLVLSSSDLGSSFLSVCRLAQRPSVYPFLTSDVERRIVITSRTTARPQCSSPSMSHSRSPSSPPLALSTLAGRISRCRTARTRSRSSEFIFHPPNHAPVVLFVLKIVANASLVPSL